MENTKTSRFEILVREYLAHYFYNFEPTYNARPEFLKNESTQKNLELDIWYKSLGFAVEVNGIAHQLKAIKRRDSWKLRRCRRDKVKLFSVKNIHELSKDRLGSQIRDYLHGKGLHDLAKTIIPYPHSKKMVLWDYKPSKSAYGNLHSRVKKQLKLESAYAAQERETAELKKRMRIKHGNELKIVGGHIILSEYA